MLEQGRRIRRAGLHEIDAVVGYPARVGGGLRRPDVHAAVHLHGIRRHYLAAKPHAEFLGNGGLARGRGPYYGEHVGQVTHAGLRGSAGV
jgi:hypothetical protein